jgi:hypothetical protein
MPHFAIAAAMPKYPAVVGTPYILPVALAALSLTPSYVGWVIYIIGIPIAPVASPL